MDSLTGLLLRPENLYLMAGVWALLETLKRVFPRLVKYPIWVRLAPVLPVALCCAGVWIPGVADPTATLGVRILVGIILGYTVAGSHKIVMQGVLGRDSRLAKEIVGNKEGDSDGNGTTNPPVAP